MGSSGSKGRTSSGTDDTIARTPNGETSVVGASTSGRRAGGCHPIDVMSPSGRPPIHVPAGSGAFDRIGPQGKVLPSGPRAAASHCDAEGRSPPVQRAYARASWSDIPEAGSRSVPASSGAASFGCRPVARWNRRYSSRDTSRRSIRKPRTWTVPVRP